MNNKRVTDRLINDSKDQGKHRTVSRKDFIYECALGALAITTRPILGWSKGINTSRINNFGPASHKISLDQNWFFGGKFKPGSLESAFNDSDFLEVMLPHCVASLSWQNWKPDDWEAQWIYRRHFDLPERYRGLRIIIHFDAAMVGTIPAINGHFLPEHLGGYLPSKYEITKWVKDKDNVLAVKVDSRWLSVPPEGSPIGPKRIDYLEPGGITRPAHLEVVPQIFISDVFAKPVNVLEDTRKVEVTCTLDAAVLPSEATFIQVEMRDGDHVVSRSRKQLKIEKKGLKEIQLDLTDLGKIKLWDVNSPQLYDVVATLIADDKPVHDYRVRVGLREARFDVDGFYLNGRRLNFFGLDRHELFPYVGFAMPSRVMRRDAEILRHEFNCNMVRCSHYPQNEAFFNACDELGLMVWEEVPGWGYLGDDSWKKLLVRDVHDMVMRDRNHPSIIIWGVRVNESHNDPVLYRKTKKVAKSLDDSRPTSGSMTSGSMKTWKEDWHQDVFAYDDYHASQKGGVGIRKPLDGVPYMLSETVGQFNYQHPKEGFNATYRRAGDVKTQQLQAIWHAQAHSRAADYPRIAGTIAWCGFDYGSLINSHNGVKCPGVADIFRIPKLGASFYQAQVDPDIRPVIKPSFYWDFGPETPNGPGKNAAIFSNCERLELFIGGKPYATLQPDWKNYPHIKFPPFFADLNVREANTADLRIEGYIHNKMVLSKSYSSDKARDRFYLKSDDSGLIGDGSDATRVEFGVTDRYGEVRLLGKGKVSFELDGRGVIVGDNPFLLDDSGGVGAVWIKAMPGSSGMITLNATHSSLGKKSVTINIRHENHSYEL